MDFEIVVGVTLCFLFHSSCTLRRRDTSSIACFMDRVTLSAYKITFPPIFRAARPMVWIRLVRLRRNPSLSASKITTSDTSGRSRPSRRRLTPIITSIVPLRRSVRISDRSRVSTSECRYETRTARSFKYSVKSSAIRLVSVVTNTRSCLSARI